MPQGDPLASKDYIAPDDLFDLPLIVPNRWELQLLLSAWLQKDLSLLQLSTTYNLIHTAALAVRNNLGYAFVPDKLTLAEQERGLCFRPLAPSMEEKLCLAWKKYQTLSKAATIYKDNLTAMLAH